jgi:hypothetical protein
VWNKEQPMSFECNKTSMPDVSVGGVIIISQTDIPKTIASSFSSVCNSDNYDPSFKVLKTTHNLRDPETLPLNFSLRVAEAYKACPS